MRTEEECKPKERYLFTDEIVSEASIEYLKHYIKNLYKDKIKDKFYENFIHWIPRKNEVLLFTKYAYADFKIPKGFHYVVNLDNPSEHIKCSCKLTQVIYEGIFPIDSIEDGHKHFCVFEFENKIPDMIHKLHVTKGQKFGAPIDTFRIGICTSYDFPFIKKNIEHQLALKKK